MKKLWTSLVVAGLLVFTGCNTSPTGGGNPNKNTSNNTKGETGHDATFKIKGPENLTAHTVKHGATEKYKVTVSKGKDFKEDLAFTAKVKPADKGVTATVEPKSLKASDPAEVEVKVTATDKAAAGSYTIEVAATPANASDHTGISFEVKVPEK
jgi:hypothetical protein